MQNIAALYGAGRNSLKAAHILRSLRPDIDVRYMVENKDYSKLGEAVACGNGKTLRVISLAALETLYADEQCTFVIVPAAYHLFDLREIRSCLHRARIAAEDIYAVPFNRLQVGDNDTASVDVMTPFDSLIQIYCLDIHVADHCNLRCKACAHFSSLVSKDINYEDSLIKKSLRHLHRIVPNIHIIALLGGEPLLHPEINTIIGNVRKFYPYAVICLTTNGILLAEMPPDFFHTIKDNNIILKISLYPPMQKNIDRLLKLLKSKEIVFYLNRYDSFERRLMPKPIFEKERMFAKCGHNMALRGSRLGWCVMALFTDYYNKRFGAGKLPEDPGVDIFAHENGRSLLDALHRPLELCAHCVSRDTGQMFFEPWAQANPPKPEDWFIRFPFAETLPQLAREGR
jgi:hypothetical protein